MISAPSVGVRHGLDRWLFAVLWSAGRAVLIVFVVLSVTFLLFAVLPTDPIRAAVGVNADEHTVAQLRSDLGYDRPLPVQLGHRLWGVIHLDLGRSLVTDRPVRPTVLHAFRETLAYVVTALLLSAAMSGLLVMGGHLAGPRAKTTVLLIAKAGTTVPSLVVSIVGGSAMLALAGGIDIVRADIRDIVFAGIALAVFPTFSLTEIALLESAAIEQRPYVTAARSFGYGQLHILWRYILPSALSPWLGHLSNVAATLVTGSIVIETVFSLPGLGRLLLQSVLRNDYPMVQGVVIVSVASFLIIDGIANLLLRQRRWMAWR
jgi:peptide/nickel transport system permease protein